MGTILLYGCHYFLGTQIFSVRIYPRIYSGPYHGFGGTPPLRSFRAANLTQDSQWCRGMVVHTFSSPMGYGPTNPPMGQWAILPMGRGMVGPMGHTTKGQPRGGPQ